MNVYVTTYKNYITLLEDKGALAKIYVMLSPGQGRVINISTRGEYIAYRLAAITKFQYIKLFC